MSVSKVSLLSAFIFFCAGCNEDSVNNKQTIEPEQLIEALDSFDLPCELQKKDFRLDIIEVIPNVQPFGVYKGADFSFALYDKADIQLSSLDDVNGTISLLQNQNLTLVGMGSNSEPYAKVLNQLKSSISLKQLGNFMYPLLACTLVVIFISGERLYSMRSGLTFPSKIAKALRDGEFPDPKWKKRSAAERIAWVATKENPSVDSLRSYARLEINSMYRGLFLLEVVISGAPLIGLLGTVTGLVKVFSQIPASGGVGNPAIFSEGITLALLTTIAGLAIAIPTLIIHSYITRLIEKRSSSLDWLTERLIDSICSKEEEHLDLTQN